MKPINLQGLRVLNTRPEDQGQALNHLIGEANGKSLHYPLLVIKPCKQTWLEQLPSLDKVHHALFTSVNAVYYGLLPFSHSLHWPTSINIIAIGNATAKALADLGYPAAVLPTLATSEQLLELDNLQDVQQKTILLFKGKGGRTLITNTLRQRGAQLTELSVYQRLKPPLSEALETCWRENKVDIILYTSQEAMLNLFALLGQKANAWLKKTPCLVISKRLANAAALLGIEHVLTCSTDSIIDALHQFNQGFIHGKSR